MQTGEGFLLAERQGWIAGGGCDGARRTASPGSTCSPPARRGRDGALVRAIGARAQDGGLRLVRAQLPRTVNPAWPTTLQRWATCPSAAPTKSSATSGSAVLTVERRLPLLTVREQRRSDANAIAALADEDPWPFEQGSRPGWFVAADGDRVVGVIQSRKTRGGTGLAAIREPRAGGGAYEGRGLDAWMVERAADYAGTHGSHTAELPLTERTAHLAAKGSAGGPRVRLGPGARGADHYVKRLRERARPAPRGRLRAD